VSSFRRSDSGSGRLIFFTSNCPSNGAYFKKRVIQLKLDFITCSKWLTVILSSNFSELSLAFAKSIARRCAGAVETSKQKRSRSNHNSVCGINSPCRVLPVEKIAAGASGAIMFPSAPTTKSLYLLIVYRHPERCGKALCRGSRTASSFGAADDLHSVYFIFYAWWTFFLLRMGGRCMPFSMQAWT